MNIKALIMFSLLSLAVFSNISAHEKSLLSPNGKLEIIIYDDVDLTYRVLYDGTEILSESKLGLEFKDRTFLGTSSKILNTNYGRNNNTWENHFGKTRIVKNNYKEMIVDCSIDKKFFRIIIRAYDDGIAFRYDLPAESGFGNFILTKELTQFNFSENNICWLGEPSGCAESLYPQNKISDISAEKKYVLPMLVQTAKGFIAIAEADLSDWAGMFVSGSEKNNETNYGVEVNLAERSDKNGAVISSVPRVSPWRIIMFGKTEADLIISNIVLNLSTPSKIKDISWIKPGITAWDAWWTGINPYEKDEKYRCVEARGNTQSHKEYIDFASEMGWQYQLIDWYWYENMWKPEADPTKPAPHVDVHELVKYAKKKNIKLLIWLNSTDVKNLGEEKVLSTVAGWGFAGVKIDFMDSDAQETVCWYEKVLTIAAKYKLLVNFHGAYKPTGLARTYPNFITQEGVLGNEYNKLPGNKCTPLHTITLPFTRGLLGPMDFTPGGFINKSVNDFKLTYPTEVMGTRSRQLAMTVVYESPLLCLCDAPQNYKGKLGADFLKSIPTVWDETKVISAEVAKHIVIARRSGNKWYLAAMNGDDSFETSIQLSFLSSGNWNVESYSDDFEKYKPDTVIFKKEIIRSTNKLNIKLNSAGGFAAVIYKVK